MSERPPIFRVTVRQAAVPAPWLACETVGYQTAKRAVADEVVRALETGARCLIELTAAQPNGKPQLLRRVTTGWESE